MPLTISASDAAFGAAVRLKMIAGLKEGTTGSPPDLPGPIALNTIPAVILDLYEILAICAIQVPTGSPQQLPSFPKASLPSASPAARMIYVTDDVGGAVPAFSDGSNWRRVTDRNVIS